MNVSSKSSDNLVENLTRYSNLDVILVIDEANPTLPIIITHAS